jgi:glycosyltransferase involved in cell wall biosynthesis
LFAKIGTGIKPSGGLRGRVVNTVPAISVLMTVFNAGHFLDAAIRSIVGQTFRSWEMILVDDASEDASRQVARDWERRDGRIRVIPNVVNKGQTACLNQGLSEARGRWVARQDADDLSHPLRLARQFECVTADPSLALLGTCGRIVDAGDRLVGLLDMPLTAEEIRWTAPFLNPFIHTSVLFRTAVVRDEFGGYDESYRIAQDYDLWTRIAARHPAANLAARLVCYRHHASSLSKAGRDTAFEEAARVSKREARRVLGREPAAAEEALLADFREGLRPRSRRAFWRFYDALRGRGKFLRLAARHRLKAAGALARENPPGAAADVLAALTMDFCGTVGWLWERRAG